MAVIALVKNPSGIDYTLVSREGEKTEVHRGEKVMIFNAPLSYMVFGWKLWKEGRQLIQNAFPLLTSGEREFLITGITPGEWEKLFAEDEKE